MKRIIVTSAGRGPAINFCRSLNMLKNKEYYIIGLESNKYSLLNVEADERILCPSGESNEFIPFLKKVIQASKADFLYASKTNEELWKISEYRSELDVNLFLPEDKDIKIFENKYETYLLMKKAGIKVPRTILINKVGDLEVAFSEFKGNKIWLREIIGSGGKNSIPTDDINLAKSWINRYNGWGNFTASEVLTKRTATWIGIWKDGNLIISQSRERLYWEYSELAPSGVTGITGAQITKKSKLIDEIAEKAIKACVSKPHGIISVDFTYDYDGIPNPTEIQASRFYTSIYFLAKAGLNLPHIMLKCAFDEKVEKFKNKYSPLEDNLLWVKFVDCLPKLSTLDDLDKIIKGKEV
ncbi:hypothetical protein Aargi30884_17300 [Amedibacterium intestinale]|uniref:ATP-grasp domain-containing protein n=1 Tax=Amedibacterium intestinale TaxID=2583452 RepID=A0A6N4TJC0_9FIRM|nr:carboxylate--amine ligase [Amedibacterium intestinale]BBK22827.1 hypothetical protein Aargi30884_17300 [Amedibacterium intestinale]